MKNFPYVSEKNAAAGYKFTPTYYMDGSERNILSAKVYDGVTTLGNYVFYKCTKLATYELHDGITNIGRGVFQANGKVVSFTVPASVTKIERNAFNGCQALTDVYIPSPKTELELDVFVASPTVTIHAPVGSAAEAYAQKNKIPFVAE